MSKQWLHVTPEELQDACFVVRPEFGFDTLDSLSQPVPHLFQRGKRSDLPRGINHVQGHLQLLAQIGPNRLVAYPRRIAHVDQTVERVHIVKDDLLELGDARPLLLLLQIAQSCLAETPLDRRVDRRVLALDERLHTVLELVQVALECGGEERDDVHQSLGIEGVEVSWPRRGQLHEPDQLVVDVKRVEKKTTVPVFPQVVFIAGA